jgi:hypothetical protein
MVKSSQGDMMHYHDFALRAYDWQDTHFKVEVTGSPVDRMRQPERVQYREALFSRVLGKLEFKGIRHLDELIHLGEALADLLLPGQVREMLLRSLDTINADEGLRLRLLLDDPQIANLPWEYLYLQRTPGEKGLAGFLALDPRIVIVRHEAMPQKPGAVQATRPLKVVVALSSPSDLMSLDLEQERRYITEALAEMDGLELQFVEQITVEALGTAASGSHIFHFAGHGYGPEEESSGALIFVDEQARSHPFPADKLAQTLAGVRLVVLGACESGRRNGVNVWSGMASTLMRSGIPAAVAMQYEIYDRSAIAFTRGFYYALAIGFPVDQAVTQGRLAILNLDGPFDLDFGVPVLYMRAADGLLFPALTADPILAEERKQLEIQVRQQVEELFGEMTGIEGGEMLAGTIDVDQRAQTIGAEGKMIGVKLDRIGGGASQTK